jgi:hypothetical protein
MTLYLKDEATSNAVRKLAKRDGSTLTEAVRKAVNRELALTADEVETTALGKLQDVISLRRVPGVNLGKGFYDSLYED